MQSAGLLSLREDTFCQLFHWHLLLMLSSEQKSKPIISLLDLGSLIQLCGNENTTAFNFFVLCLQDFFQIQLVSSLYYWFFFLAVHQFSQDEETFFLLSCVHSPYLTCSIVFCVLFATFPKLPWRILLWRFKKLLSSDLILLHRFSLIAESAGENLFCA